MKLHAYTAGLLNTITGYGDGYVAVNGERYESNVLVLPERVIHWEAQRFDALTPQNFVVLAALKPEIVLLGTGTRLRFPHPSVTRALAEANIGVEVMDLRAACRTYNVLVAEQRKVAAAILFA